MIYNNKDLKMQELINIWLDIRFPNALEYYRQEWHERYNRNGIKFINHMDGESKDTFKKVLNQIFN